MKLQRLAKRNSTKMWQNTFTLLFRFALGLPVGGYRRTDSTFFRHGTTDLSRGSSRLQLKKTGRWDYLSFFERMLLRWGTIAVCVSTAYGYFFARTTLLLALVWAGVVMFLIVAFSIMFIIKFHEKLNRRMRVKRRKIS